MRRGRPAEAVGGNEDGAVGEGVTEGLEGGMAVEPPCGDDGQSVGIGTGAPLGAEPTGDLAEDHAGPQGTLAIVVGGGNVAARDEDEEVAAALADGAGGLAAGIGGGGGGEQPGEPPRPGGAATGPGGTPPLPTPLAPLPCPP